MDKELLRIVIITLGVLVMIGMILWSFFTDKRSRRKIDFYDEGDPLDKIDDSLVIKTENDDFDIVPLGGAVDGFDDELYQQQNQATVPNFENDFIADPINGDNDYPDFNEDNDLADIADDNDFAIQEPGYADDTNGNAIQEPEYTKAIKIPEIIQVHILALDYDGFSGKQLLKAFQSVGLKYGSLKIFEKLDKNRRVKFSVASMIEPGTFPDTGAELNSFNCPGIVFFLQPGELEDPVAAFDEYIKTIDLVADKLDGVKLDSKRDPLSKETIDGFRKALSI